MTTFHCKSRVSGSAVPTGGATVEASSVEDATAQVRAMNWPDGTIMATIDIASDAEVLIQR